MWWEGNRSAPGGVDSDGREAIADVLVEILSLGFRLEQFLINLDRDAEISIDGAVAEFQLQPSTLLLVGCCFSKKPTVALHAP
jgi:hypothetical protein